MYKSIIKQIASELDAGGDCYYNFRNGEIISIPNFGANEFDEEFREAFKDDLEEIENNKNDFLKFEVLESFESFKIMKDFVEEVDDTPLKTKLNYALENKKPFRHFKNLVEDSNFREKWFQFKQNEIEKMVWDRFEKFSVQQDFRLSSN